MQDKFRVLFSSIRATVLEEFSLRKDSRNLKKKNQ